jgi:hypothetical protein
MDKKMLLIILVSIGLMASCSTQLPKEREPLSISVGVLYEEKSLDDLIGEAEMIVIGKVDNVLPSRWSTPNGKRPSDDEIPDYTIYTDVVFQISQSLKGERNKPSLYIRTFGGQVGQDQMTVSLETQYKINQTYLLFLSLDQLGSTSQVGSAHYLTSGPQGVYEIIGGKVISLRDEWPLEELIAYIQNSPLTTSASVTPVTPESKEIMQRIETAYDIEAEAAYSFDLADFPSMYINDPRYEVNLQSLEFVRDITHNPTLKSAGYLDYKTAYFTWWKEGTERFDALQDKAKSENREVTQDEIKSLIDSKWQMPPARAKTPIREISLRFISISIENDIATVYLHDGTRTVVMVLILVDKQWYIAGLRGITLNP